MIYDQTDIPAGYDRGRGLDPEVLDLWMDAVHAHFVARPVSGIVDLGCGTGRFSQVLAQRFNTDVTAIDPSSKMLEQARAKGHDRRVHYVRGRAEAIPLAARSVDGVFSSMSFHHFADTGLAAQECRRVLRDRGLVFVRTGTREQIASYAYVQFFPSSPSIIEQTLPDRATLRRVFEGAGFQLAAAELLTQTIAPNWATYADKLAAGGDSVLAQLSREEFEAGVARVRRYAQAHDEAVVEPIDLLVFQ
jgi:ubiquinone/menaquinone biosynthesis C-methylase UbiE